MKRIDLIAGARPNFMKIAPIIDALNDAETRGDGITEETTVPSVSRLTLRDNIERPETITIGTNELIGTDPSKLPPAPARVMTGQWRIWAIPPTWDGKTAVAV